MVGGGADACCGEASIGAWMARSRIPGAPKRSYPSHASWMCGHRVRFVQEGVVSGESAHQRRIFAFANPWPSCKCMLFLAAIRRRGVYFEAVQAARPARRIIEEICVSRKQFFARARNKSGRSSREAAKEQQVDVLLIEHI